jgi:DNA integrity scanning protein DisA with diadenylate cyclase activity
MKLVTAIDGAVLLDFDGLCYAIGVILDGTVKPGDGDSSRGARYLAAIKYLNWSEKNDHKCLIIVVSEDGMINIFPEKKSE